MSMWASTADSMTVNISPRSQTMTDIETENFTAFAQKMRAHGLSEDLIRLFRSYYVEVTQNHTGYIYEHELLPVAAADLQHVDSLAEYREAGLAASRNTVVIKLNGGLGTSMGMTHAKSLIPIYGELRFLDIIMQQALLQQKQCGGPLPLALMNSFSTHQDTLDELKKIQEEDCRQCTPLCFVQHKFPKVSRKTLQPASYPEDPSQEWNPPGHGDLYASLVTSGVLNDLLAQGKRYAFVSNSDNLGATLEMGILGYMAEEEIPFIMEVAPRTKSDRKGGHLAIHRDGGMVLRELAQCPPDEVEAFQDITRYGLFNTNNLWVDLLALKTRIEQEGLLRLPVILNPKTVNPRDKQSEPVWQIETAMGAGISMFPGAKAVVINRDRFIPVKKCSDLLAVMSDCFELNEGAVSFSPECKNPTPQVTLDDAYYDHYDKLRERVPFGPPSLKECRSLTVKGDVSFGANVVIKGDTTIIAAGGKAYIPDNAVLEGDIFL
ncbi:UTP--glucose-1-phosphate uridylyltransferase [Oleidesulfovibrio sp.]|uniref:UTP--glucose-1-phosphate uridylyltransferase n=1 Tax=Oleidesulfovibrio sp. TaxID=2909707 RepID=UPI003A87FEF7